MTKVRHVLGISGGKDSAALAIYMEQEVPNTEGGILQLRHWMRVGRNREIGR